MKKQVFNPYLPENEYIPDGEPHVFEDRIYIFGSHDKAGGTEFCMEDYVTWSAPINDLSDWKYEGVIYRKEQDPRSKGKLPLYAPDVVRGPDGKYYLYYSVQNTSVISVAVAEKPIGPYKYYGDIKRPDGRVWGESVDDFFEFDPAVLVDDDGRIWLYSGSGQEYNRRFGRRVVGAFVHELEQNMLTTIGEPKIIMPYERFNIFKSAFFEASSIRKYNGIYYFIYAATNLTGLNYCTSSYPDRDFIYRGKIHCTSDIGYKNRGILNAVFAIGNYHGSVEKINGKYYVFDHRMTNRTFYSRQGVAEEVFLDKDGRFCQTESTSCGLNGGPLVGKGEYPAYIVCNLFSKKRMGIRWPFRAPYVTQREEFQYITEMTNGCSAGFKYFNFDGSVSKIGICVQTTEKGIIEVSFGDEEKAVAKIEIDNTDQEWKWFEGYSNQLKGKKAVYFIYKGAGVVNIKGIRFEEQ